MKAKAAMEEFYRDLPTHELDGDGGYEYGRQQEGWAESGIWGRGPWS